MSLGQDDNDGEMILRKTLATLDIQRKSLEHEADARFSGVSSVQAYNLTIGTPPGLRARAPGLGRGTRAGSRAGNPGVLDPTETSQFPLS